MQDNYRHSAKLNMYLEIGERKIDVWGCLANKYSLRKPEQIAASNAIFVTEIDGSVYKRQVKITPTLNPCEITVEHMGDYYSEQNILQC